MSKGIKVLFAIFLLIGLVSLFLPQIYNTLSDSTLKNLGTYQTIKDIDSKIPLDSITQAPQTIWNDIKNIFVTPDQKDIQQSDKTTVQPESKGFLENSLYAGLVTLIAFVLRVVGISISIGGLILVTYLSYSTLGATELETLQTKYQKLEERIAELEKKSSNY